jgi:catechol 2,3-dioxygenase-like lactoylglutathione lyase family enzyme
MLANYPVAVVIPCVDLAKARSFYGQTLGLPEMDLPMPDAPDGEPIGAAYQSGGGTMIFIYRRAEPTKADHTVAGWMVEDFDAAADDLLDRGVTFEIYPDLPGAEWDERGVATPSEAGNAGRSAWFKDPEGNILSINEMPT